MGSRFRPREEPGLFDDLPLQQGTGRSEPATESEKSPSPEPRSEEPRPAPEPMSLFSEDDEGPQEEEVTRPAFRPLVPFSAHLFSGLIDLGAVLLVLLAVWLGLWAMDIELDPVGRGLTLIFLLPFSFLYQIFPLAFWGRTLGMARVGIVARSRDGQSLSFAQSTLRWVASVTTVVTLGLPLILTATTGSCLADRLSGSQTLPAR